RSRSGVAIGQYEAAARIVRPPLPSRVVRQLSNGVLRKVAPDFPIPRRGLDLIEEQRRYVERRMVIPLRLAKTVPQHIAHEIRTQLIGNLRGGRLGRLVADHAEIAIQLEDMLALRCFLDRESV